MKPPPALDPNNVIAERELAFAPSGKASSSDDHGATMVIRFRLGRPVHHGSEWYCPFEVDGFGETRTEAAYGADSVHALLLALAKLRIVLSAMALENQGQYAFVGGPGSGLPSLFEEVSETEEASLE